MIQALIEGLSGGKKEEKTEMEMDPEAFKAMQESAMTAIAAKAGGRLPMLRGRDKELPKAPPVFDIEELRKKNEALLKKRKVI